jgi:hypothetical protein
MFFAESLGPAIDRRTDAALFEHLQVKLAGRKAASAEELRVIVEEFIRAHRLVLNAEALIRHLAINGRLAQQDAFTYRLAA